MFAVLASNIYGDSTVSSATSVTAIDFPGKVDIPTVTTSGTTVVVDWSAPNTHYSAITAYDIKFLDSGSNLVTYTTGCTETAANVLSLTQCTVNMLDLNTQLGLAVDTLIRVKVRAQNAKGWGSYSELNVGTATVETLPAVMSAPTIVSASVTTTSIPLTWTVPTGSAAGGASVSIISYDIEHSTDGTTWATAVSATTGNTYTYTITASSSSHYFHIRATNKYGTQNTYSASSVGVVGSAVPDKPDAPTVTLDGT